MCMCGAQSRQSQSLSVMPLYFPPGAAAGESFAVQDLLDAFLAPEEESRRCETSPSNVGCGALTCVRTRACSSAPSLLVLQASRFQAVLDEDGAPVRPFRQRKIHAQLAVADSVAVAAPHLQCYDLFAIVEHLGGSVAQGHYVCHAKVDSRWKTFDDAVVSDLRTSAAEAAKRAHLLFYARRGV